MSDLPGMTEFPPGFFQRIDEGSDREFYDFDRFVTHIDERAIDAVGGLYEHLRLEGRILDVMSSWISHFRAAPRELVALGMNEHELAANHAATSYVVHDLNTQPKLPFDDARFHAATCCVSVDYLVQPVAVFAEVRRVLVPGGMLVCTFSNRCFATKAVRGWLAADDEGRCRIVAEYFRQSGGWDEPQMARCTPPDAPGDPLYAVWATTAPAS